MAFFRTVSFSEQLPAITGDSVLLRLDASGSMVGSIYNGSTWVTTSYSVTLAGTGWHHVAFTFDNTGDRATLYLDGSAVAATSTTAM